MDHALRFSDLTSPDGAWFATRAAQLAAALPDPQRLEVDCCRFLDAAGDLGPRLARWRANPALLDALLRLRSFSRYGFNLAIADPARFEQVVAGGETRQVLGREALRDDLRRRLAADPAGGLAAFQHHHHLRLILGDLLDHLGFPAVVAELSDIADVLIQAACEQAEADLAPRFGRAATGFCVLAFGKLGARELNYSSDIDLLFLFGGPGATSGGREDLDHHEYAIRLGTQVIRKLDDDRGGEKLYRVDMRLRPEGDAGQLALSLAETRDYYYAVGRPWERQALIKLRPVAGDLALGERLIVELRPWVFPREQDWQELRDTRLMRRRIEERADDADVKTGAGGIRDIEFLVQYYQLGFGGRIPELQVRSTLMALEVLRARGLLSPVDADELARHYVWLRQVEHKLQMYEARQEHRLPDDAAGRAALARRCGYGGANPRAGFEAELARVRGRVRDLSDRHYLGMSVDDDAFAAFLATQDPPRERYAPLLAPFHLRDVDRAAKTLRSFAEEPFFSLGRGRTERNLARLLPLLLPRLGQCPDPDAALAAFGRIAVAAGNRAVLYERLTAHPELLATLTDLCGWAAFVIDELVRFPGLPDEMLERLLLHTWMSEDVEQEAHALIHGVADPAPPLAYLQARETAMIALRDLRGADHRLVGLALSRLAVALLRILVDRVVADEAKRHGRPRRADGTPNRFAVLGLGKLGGFELSYASDMDVIFVCDGDGACPEGREADAFWTRTAHEAIRHAGEGRLYQLDPRLRPWGEQGQMVPSAETLLRYWSEPRDLWERMAMTRIAPVAGDLRFGLEVARLVRTHAMSMPLPADAAWQVRDMRRRLEDSVAGRDHVKRGPGGYVDIEFIAHYKSLGRDPRQIPAAASVHATLDRLAAVEAIPREAATDLQRSLSVLRRVEGRARLALGKAVSSLPKDERERTLFARWAGYPDLAAMDLDLHLARERTRRWFDRLIT